MQKTAAAVRESEADRTLVITHSFKAPRERVFRAWTDPAQVARWMGPPSFQAEVDRLEARSGGRYRVIIRPMDGSAPHIVQGVYKEVVAPERLVFTWAWEGADGTPGHETLVTVEFRARGNDTEMTLTHRIFETGESRNNHNKGWTGSFDKLAALVEGK